MPLVHVTTYQLASAGKRSLLTLAFGYLIFSAGAVVAQTGQGAGTSNNQPAATAWSNSMEVPIRLIAEARQAYQGITDYSCTFVKKERLRDQLQADNLIVMMVRREPFSVYMRWAKPAEMAGQEACFVTGQNKGMMRVHATGLLLGAAGFVSMDPSDPRALQNTRHAITEAGIGNLIDRFSQRWDFENRLNKTMVRSAEYDYAKRRCIRVETLHQNNSGKEFLFYRSVLYFDKENHLPIRIENYDWPKAGGDRNGLLVESYSYPDLRLNVGLPASTWVH
jgi:hypothetical protein